MAGEFILYGARRAGSVPVEAALRLIGLAYRLIEQDLDPRELDRSLSAINPMRQVPALVLPSGELMTESAAILLWLADAHPGASLAPEPEAPGRAAFLRWLAFVSSAIYALYWVRDEPSRLVESEAAQAELKERLHERISQCWAIMDRQIEPTPYLAGASLSVLDLYVTTVSRWSPGRPAFFAAAPKLAPVVRLVDADPRLEQLWLDRYPIRPGER
ncbi:MAG: glutathione S-transferase family protein [Caulobacteraceae bacterium]